jgi:capsular exopolysaccharide synthesis family protein
VARLEREYANKLTQFKPEWPAMRELQAQIDKGKQNLIDVIAETATKARDTARTEYLTALRREQGLDDEMQRQKRAAMGLNESAVQYNNLKVEVSTRRTLLDSLLKKQSETGVASRLEGGREAEVIVVDRGLVPQESYRPSLRLNLAVGLLLGLLLGVGGAFLVEYLDRTIKSPEEVERILGLPVLGVAPDAQRRQRGYGYGYGARTLRKPADAEEEPMPHIELLPHTDPKLGASEAYRSFRTALLLSRADGLRSVVITSAQSGEGKSVTAANLACVRAQLGKSVQLVDADLRKPRQHQIFQVSNRVGLVDALTQREPLEKIVTATHIPKLSLLPSGQVPPNPAELLSSERMKECFRLALERFDLVIFDSPPVLPVTDAVLLGGMVDGVVQCVRAGVVHREDALACRDRLRQAQVRLLGTLLNGYQARQGYGRPYASSYEYAAAEKASGSAA